MLAVERRNEIEKIISENKSVLVAELAKKFEVTPETIRNDLLRLEKRGVLIRTYGGATAADGGGAELAVPERDVVNFEGKRRIGMTAARMIRDGDTVFLDASTSALHLARCLKEKEGITVITNSLRIITELAACANISIVCTGGRLNGRNMSFSDRMAERSIKESYFADKCFFSCRGATIEHGLTDSSEAEAEIKKAMIANSANAFALCDRNKLGRTGVPKITDIGRVDALITDIRLGAEWEDALAKNDTELIVV